MAEENDPQGPIMLCATSVLKPGPTRIGRIGNHITLPRTVALPQLVAGGGGALLGGILGMVLLGGVQPILMSAAFLGLAGVVLVTYQPMRGESLLAWIGLEVMSRRNRIEVDGQVAQAFIGICPITYTESGKIRIMRGAIDVPEGSVDERGVFVDDAFAERGGLLSSLGAKRSRDMFVDEPPPTVQLPPERAPQWAVRRGVALPEHAPDAWANPAPPPAGHPGPAAPPSTAGAPQVPWMSGQPAAPPAGGAPQQRTAPHQPQTRAARPPAGTPPAARPSGPPPGWAGSAGPAPR